MSDLIDREVAINALNILSEKMTPEGQTIMEQAIAVLNDIYSAEQTAKATKNPQAFFYHCECGYALCCEKNDMNYCPNCGCRLEWV